MRRKSLVLALVSFLIGAVAVSRLHVSAQELRSEIETALPLGSSREQVNAFLASHGMVEDIAAFDYPDWHPLHRRIIVLKTKNFLSTHDIHLVFYFDTQQKLSEYQVSKDAISIPTVGPTVAK